MGDGDPKIVNIRNFDDLAGKTVSHFEVLELLERCPLGSVYLARDINLERRVILKFLPNSLFSGEESQQRFIHDTKITSSLEHPNIGTIHEIDETDDGQVLVAVAHYPGHTLEETLGSGSLSMERILDYAIQLASAMDVAHRHGVVHRGIKPCNIAIGDDGILRLGDFGMAELSSETGESIYYRSPEQLRGDPVDERSDIWTLGVILFEMIAGRQPFSGEDNDALEEAILKKDPWKDSEQLPHTGKTVLGLKNIIKKCLQKYPIKRYQDARDLLDDLQQLRDKHRKKHLALLFSGNIVIVCVVVFLILFGYYSFTREPEPTSRFEVVDDPFGLGQGKVLMLHPGKADTSINRLIADLKLPEAAQIHAVEGPHPLSTVYLKIGRPDIYGEPGEVGVVWGLAAEAERQHEEIFTYSEFSILARYVISGKMEYRDGDHYKFMYPFPFDMDTYYETWFVIDHANNSYDFYIRGGSQFPTITRMATAAEYRTRTLQSLDHLLLISAADSLNIERSGRDPVYFDDFFVYPGGLKLSSPDHDWILLDNFESGEARNWKVYRTSTGPMEKRTRLPVDYF